MKVWGSEQTVTGELLVKLKTNKMKAQFLNQFNNKIDRVIKLSYGDVYVLKEKDNKLVSILKSELLSQEYIAFAEPNYILNIVKPIENNNIVTNLSAPLFPQRNKDVYTPLDPKFGQLWGLNNTGDNAPNGGTNGVPGADVDALRAWELTQGDRSVVIAVIDTGVDYTHPDLRDNIWTNTIEANGKPGVDDDNNGYIDDIHGYDFINNDGDPIDDHNHGTHCAGTIGGSHNDVGVAGVMRNVSIMGVKFLSASGSGSTEGAIRSIDYATSQNVDIMSNSWGGGGFSQALEDAIKNARDKGITFVAAAGNSATNNDNSPHYPSNYNLSNVVSVAAHNNRDDLASFSCYGKRTVHVAAPGRNILSTTKNNSYAVYSGTSMATPHVSGVIGLLFSHGIRLSHEELRERLLATSVPVRSLRSKTVYGGRINAYNLLTDTRPERSMPNPNDWITQNLKEKFESEHPYPNKKTVTREFKSPGAKYMRIHISRFELEKRYDTIKILDKSGAIVDTISGSGEDHYSEYVEGDSLTVKFTSDYSVNKWGFLIEKIQVIRENNQLASK